MAEKSTTRNGTAGERPRRSASFFLGICACVVAGPILQSCASPPPDERLHSTLWVQTSAEYGVTTGQVYQMATERLDAAIDDPTHSALDFGDDPAGLPTAVVIDIDETVLDNSGHTARAILSRQGFNQTSWREWVAEASAPAVPGAVEYLQTAARAGVAIIYLSNRHTDLDAATRENLVAIGAPMREGVDILMTRGREPGWTRDKSSRRRVCARQYRVLQIVGDDLADFIQLPEGADDEQRVSLARRHAKRWGRQWFMLPNPIYGSWEKALTPDGGSIFRQPMEHKFRQLEPR